MHIFSLMIIIIFGIWIVKDTSEECFEKCFSFSIFCVLTINIGYFIKIGTIKIDYFWITFFFTGLIACVLQCRHFVVKKKLFYSMLILFCGVVCALIIGLVCGIKAVSNDMGGWGAYLFGVNNETTLDFSTTQIKELLNLLSCMAIVIYIDNFEQKKWNRIIRRICKWSKFVICFGICEFICIYILQIYDINIRILQPIFGLNDSTYIYSLARGSGYQLQGLFREPSQYVRGLFIIIFLMWTDIILNNKKENIKWIIVCIFLMLCSMSFTMLLLLAVLTTLFMLYMYKKNPRMRSLILIFSGSMFLLLSVFLGIIISTQTYYGVRLQNAIKILQVISNNPNLSFLYGYIGKDGSSVIRIGSAYANLVINLKKNILIGIGLGNSIALSYTSNLITDLGIIGTCIYVYIFVFYKKKKEPMYYFACAIIFFMAFFTPIIHEFGADTIILFNVLNIIYTGENHKVPLKKSIKMCT